MNIDFSTVLNALPSLEQSLEKIENTYCNVEWDDDVHQSYIPYIRECNNAREVLRRASIQLESIMNELRCVKSSDNVNDELEQISRECDNIRV